MPLTLSSADEVTTIKREVFNGLNINWKGTEVELPVVVIPGAGFDVLLGLAWVGKAKVGLYVGLQVLLHGVQKHTFEKISLTEPPFRAICTFFYALEHCRLPSQGKAMLKIAPFEQGRN